MEQDFKSPVGDFESIENMARARFGMDQSRTGAIKATGEATDINRAADVSSANALQAKQAELKVAQQQAQDLQDPGKYEKVRNAQSGGFDFFDPLGNKVTLSQYSKVTQKRRDEVLKDSLDVKDLQYLQEHFNLEDYMNIKVRSKSNALAPEDQEFIDTVEEQNPDLKSIPLNDIIKKFRSRYSGYYDQGTSEQDVERFFVDSPIDEGESDTRSNFQRVKDLVNPRQ